MGYGGALFWTGLTRNLRKQWPNKRIILIYRKTWLDFILRRGFHDGTVYVNNPDIDMLINQVQWWLWYKYQQPASQVIAVRMYNPKYHYWTRETREKIDYKTGKHAIQFACDAHDIKKAVLKPKIKLTPEEITRVDRLIASKGLKQFICIEPHAKNSYTPNKEWFWDRWQEVVTSLKNHWQKENNAIEIVQIGSGSKQILDSVVDLTGQCSFRETARILQKSLFLISCVGGLTHLAKAMNKRSIVLVSAWEPLELATYPDDINLYHNIDCQCRGLKIPCPINRLSMRLISAEEVVRSAQKLMIATNE